MSRPVVDSGHVLGLSSAEAITESATLHNESGENILSITNNGSNVIYVSGEAGVTSGNGYPLYVGESMLVKSKFYAVCATTETSDLRMIKLMLV